MPVKFHCQFGFFIFGGNARDVVMNFGIVRNDFDGGEEELTFGTPVEGTVVSLYGVCGEE